MTRLSWPIAIALLLGALHSCLRYFPSLLLVSAHTTLLLLVILAALYACGRRLSDFLALNFRGDPALESAAALSLGLAALSYAMLLLGVARLFYPACAALLLGIFLWSG
ncbi:MAG TPA: hypothetical protein PLL10_07360, partial [Elusimicrobiales bacterium]|nr:hypothetical protein [Elusimicrobiales bacterium]